MINNVKGFLFSDSRSHGWTSKQVQFIYYISEVNDIEKHTHALMSTYAKPSHMWPDRHLTCPRIDAPVVHMWENGNKHI